MAEKTGLMICGHGSRDARAVAEFARLAADVRARVGDAWPVEHGYLEFATPIIRSGLDKLRDQGCSRILAVPGMLFAAGHAKNDIPSVLNRYGAEHGLRIDYARELGLDPKMLRAGAERIEQAEAGAARKVSRHDSLLMVVGRGSSDPDANSNVCKLTRMLAEGLGFGWAETAYSGVTFPLVAPALERAARLGFARIIVFPWFLFTGILVKRIYAAVDEAVRAFPETEFLKAPYLNNHPLVVETFIERARGILEDDTAMNCGLCKYRTRILGFESQLGEPQMSHHHHVEGPSGHEKNTHGGHFSNKSHGHIPASVHKSDARGEHAHHHGHDHGGASHHDHHHHPPYPHADHPLGPRTLDEE